MKHEDWLRHILRFTKELFPGKVEIELQDDPDEQDKTYIVFNVSFSGHVHTQIQRQLLWHEMKDEVRDTQFSDIRLLISSENG